MNACRQISMSALQRSRVGQTRFEGRFLLTTGSAFSMQAHHRSTCRSLWSDRYMIQCTMYHTSIDVYPSLSFDLESIVLLLASMLLAMIMTAELDYLLWHATDCTGKVPGELYIIIIIIIIIIGFHAHNF